MIVYESAGTGWRSANKPGCEANVHYANIDGAIVAATIAASCCREIFIVYSVCASDFINDCTSNCYVNSITAAGAWCVPSPKWPIWCRVWRKTLLLRSFLCLARYSSICYICCYNSCKIGSDWLQCAPRYFSLTNHSWQQRSPESHGMKYDITLWHAQGIRCEFS